MGQKGLKIAFVNDSCEHVGVEYISAVLKAGGHETRLFVDPLLFDDEFVTVKFLSRWLDRKERIVDALSAYKPDLVAMSVVSSFYPWACEMARLIKERMDVPIIFGGIHPTLVPERVIQDPAVDMVCVGEGEYPVLELADSLASGRIDTTIRNIWFKSAGGVVRNPLRALITDLDALPMADKDLYYAASPHFSKSYYIAAGRGCPYECSYCSSAYLNTLHEGLGPRLRQRSVAGVIRELTQAKERYPLAPVIFLDDCFGADPVWLKEFSKAYRDNVGTEFHCSMFPTHVTEEKLRWLKEAGCREIEIGVQSWDEEVREKVFHRHVSNEAMLGAMRLIKKSGINLVVGDILGYHGQKDEHILKAAEIYAAVRPERTYPFVLRYFPRLPITEAARSSGVLKPDAYEKVMDGRTGKYLSPDGVMMEKNMMRYLLLFLLVRVLPRPLAMSVVRRRMHRWLPATLTPAAVSILSNLSAVTLESRVNRQSVRSRYFFHIKEQLLGRRRS
jgi:radical SAM superfamily enzyme YgiQ (UPF0313 family)